MKHIRNPIVLRFFFSCLFSTYLLLYNVAVNAHGGVFLEKDICVIQIGFFKAHFTIYQPQISQHEEFCEDIPGIGGSLFVMEYLHEGLREMQVDFRIINDVQNLGRFTKAEDIKKIDNIDKHTIFYKKPNLSPDGIFLVFYEFEQNGNYIGIVNASKQNDSIIYTAIFPFQVGNNNWGYIPLFIGLAMVLQLLYWLMNGGYKRLYKKLSQ